MNFDNQVLITNYVDDGYAGDLMDGYGSEGDSEYEEPVNQEQE